MEAILRSSGGYTQFPGGYTQFHEGYTRFRGGYTQPCENKVNSQVDLDLEFDKNGQMKYILK